MPVFFNDFANNCTIVPNHCLMPVTDNTQRGWDQSMTDRREAACRGGEERGAHIRKEEAHTEEAWLDPEQP